MKVGDIVRLTEQFITVDHCYVGEYKTVMIVEGPNEVGNIRVLLPNASTRWVHCSDVEYLTQTRRYLKE